MGLQWHLKQGGVFNTPEAVLVRSDEGLGKEEEGEGGGAELKGREEKIREGKRIRWKVKMRWKRGEREEN